MGWTWQAWEHLGRASRLDTEARDLAELRTEAATCMAGVDLKELRVVAPELNAFCLAFDPDGKRLAIGGSRSLLLIPLQVIDVRSGEQIHDLSFGVSPGLYGADTQTRRHTIPSI